MQKLILALLIFLISLTGCAQSADAPIDVTHAKIETSLGNIIIELYPEEAPVTVANFLQYATDGQFDRTIFHRVVSGFVVQGGGFTKTFRERRTRDPIAYEGDNGLKNERGTIAMARTIDPNSASSQWFFNLKHNEKLDHFVNDLGPRYGYTVFGKVVEGMEFIDAIGALETGPGGPFRSEVPAETVLIIRVDPVEWPAKE